MIEIRVKFHTNKIDKNKEMLKQKECLDSGFIYLTANRLHGIKASKPKPFLTMTGLIKDIEKVLISNGISVHHDSRNKLYKI